MKLIRKRKLRSAMCCCHRIALAISFILGIQAFQITAYGQTSDSRWVNESGGTFHNASNWDAGIPDFDVNALFGIDSFYDVELEIDTTVRSFQQSNGEIIWFGGSTLTMNQDSSINSGSLTISDEGTRFDALERFSIGQSGDGVLNIRRGALLNTNSATIGQQSGSSGAVTVAGPGSRWQARGVTIGESGLGSLHVENGGQVEAQAPSFWQLGEQAGSVGAVTVDGTDSLLNVSGIIVGNRGRGEVSVRNGGAFRSVAGGIGISSGSEGSVLIDGKGSNWQHNGASLLVADSGAGELIIDNGGSVSTDFGVSIGRLGNGTGNVTVRGDDSNLTALNISIGGRSSLTIADGATVTSTTGFNLVGAAENSSVSSSAVAVVRGAGSSWRTKNIAVGDESNGILDIHGGAHVSGALSMGRFKFATVQVGSGGSLLDTSQSGFLIGWGNGGNGYLRVQDGGRVESSSVSIANEIGSTGTAEVRDGNTTWESSQQLSIGSQGDGSLFVTSGGRVRNESATLAATDRGSATVLVTGSDLFTGGESRWELESTLSMGNFGNASLDINHGGLVHVGLGGFSGRTVIGENGNVTLDGGRFEFGTTDVESFGRIGGESGSVAGDLEIDGFNHISSLFATSLGNLDISEVLAANEGVIYGDGSTALGLGNTVTGELRTRSDEWARFGGVGNINSGEINNFGGLIEFEHDLTNTASGFISGRGQLIVGGGLTNEGVMAFSVGTTDVLGDVELVSEGQIVTSGFASTTFFDDVVHNGMEIRTADGSATVFLGGYSGAGSFTGGGDVFFEGDLRPGNSPDIIEFGGNVILSASLNSTFELGGIGLGEFDMLDIAGDLSIDGNLSIELIDGFTLGTGDQFLIAQVQGNTFGQFTGFTEGDLVGTYGGRELFITYVAGNGNDVGLFTAIPEPGSTAILLSASCLLMLNRRRQTVT